MFQQLIASNPSRASRKPLTLVYSAIIHGFLILLLIAVPLVHLEAIGNLRTLIASPPPLSAPRGTVCQLTSSHRQRRPLAPKPTTMFTPVYVPPRIDLTPLGTSEVGTDPADSSPVGVPIGESRASSGFLLGFDSTSARTVLPPAPPVSGEKHERPDRIRQGGEVQHASLIRQMKPSYPQLAKTARVQGSVILEAIIDREGRVVNLKVLSGHPLLIPAAVEAVQQWRYRPTLLNGQPVEVLTQVTVNFSLGAP